jgi:hypothetical protein
MVRWRKLFTKEGPATPCNITTTTYTSNSFSNHGNKTSSTSLPSTSILYRAASLFHACESPARRLRFAHLSQSTLECTNLCPPPLKPCRYGQWRHLDWSPRYGYLPHSAAYWMSKTIAVTSHSSRTRTALYTHSGEHGGVRSENNHSMVPYIMWKQWFSGGGAERLSGTWMVP